jgi:APA family basic amino acid/polyamine antiporter
LDKSYYIRTSINTKIKKMQQIKEQDFKRELGLFDGIMLVVGSMIGSGIFIVSSDIARQVGSAGWLLFIWLITAITTTIAAVSYGELSAMYPKAGGQYVFLQEAYGRLVAFLFGWSFFAVIQTGTIAAVGVAFSKFAAYTYEPFSENNILLEIGSFHLSAAQLVSIFTIIFLTYLNSLGVKNGKILQTVLTIIKVGSIFGLVIFGFSAMNADVWSQNWADAWHIQSWNSETLSWSSVVSVGLISAFAAAMVGSTFSSVTWEGVTFIAGEIKNPKRNVGLSLFLGTFIVGLIYVVVNIMYLAVLPLQDIATAPSDRVGVVAAKAIFGEVGTVIIAVLIMISTFSCNNGLIMTGARVYYTMAKDGLFFRKAAILNKNGVPSWALWAQCLWTSVLCLTGKYGQLLDFVVIIVLIFYILTIVGIFILRKKQPDLERPYKAFGYPYLPAFYVLFSLVFCLSLLITKFETCGWGVFIMLLGIPIYYVLNKQNSAR